MFHIIGTKKDKGLSQDKVKISIIRSLFNEAPGTGYQLIIRRGWFLYCLCRQHDIEFHRRVHNYHLQKLLNIIIP